jgi:hypothetical protein
MISVSFTIYYIILIPKNCLRFHTRHAIKNYANFLYENMIQLQLNECLEKVHY